MNGLTFFYCDVWGNPLCGWNVNNIWSKTHYDSMDEFKEDWFKVMDDCEIEDFGNGVADVYVKDDPQRWIDNCENDDEIEELKEMIDENNKILRKVGFIEFDWMHD